MHGICKSFQINFHVLPFKNLQNTSNFVTLFLAHGDVVVRFAIFYIVLFQKRKRKKEKKKRHSSMVCESWWVMSTHFYSCRHLLGLQVQRFVEQQQVSLKWITQGLSNSGRLEVKAIPLKQPCNYDTESLLCPQHTQYACQTYRCTSSAKR
jgi:hypothetical protein